MRQVTKTRQSIIEKVFSINKKSIPEGFIITELKKGNYTIVKSVFGHVSTPKITVFFKDGETVRDYMIKEFKERYGWEIIDVNFELNSITFEG